MIYELEPLLEEKNAIIYVQHNWVKEVKHKAAAFYALLKSFKDSNNICDASNNQLASEFNWSTSTVIKWLKILEENDYIKRRRVKGKRIIHLLKR